MGKKSADSVESNINWSFSSVFLDLEVLKGLTILMKAIKHYSFLQYMANVY